MRTEKPTQESIEQACKGLTQFFAEFDAYPARNPRVPWTITHAEIERVRTLRAAAEPAPDPRPDDVAKLARLTAIELRGRGIRARLGMVGPVVVVMQSGHGYSMHRGDFDNLGPIGCADEIQRQEAERAKQWAGDV